MSRPYRFDVLVSSVKPAAPPTNETGFHEWTIGSTFYSVLAMTEVLGNTNTSQVIDIQANSNNEFTPGYAVYERTKFLLIVCV